MSAIEPLGLSANQWQFLVAPDRYVAASANSERRLVVSSTERQFATARDILVRLNGSHGQIARRGILLADDVGLGKTTVAALVAWVFAGVGKRVRILAPNDVMARRWTEELHAHIRLLKKCAPRLEVGANRIKDRRTGRLLAGSIQVLKHSYAGSLDCDLLIVDEAHRAKGEATTFSKNLHDKKKSYRRALILTATPFSIHLDELQRMLKLVGGETAREPVRVFSRALDDLHAGSTARSPECVAERLVTKAAAAVRALGTFVIRHSVDDLPKEKSEFGDIGDWNIPVPQANQVEIELMLRIDRALRLAKSHGVDSVKATNDARFHVGWRHFDAVCADLSRNAQQLPEAVRALVDHQLKVIARLRCSVGSHTKMAAVAEAVKMTVDQGEKVVLFCHHHATAQELTAYLAAMLPGKVAANSPGPSIWKAAWNDVLPSLGATSHEAELRATFIEWLCADLIREQIWGWLRRESMPPLELSAALKTARGRHSQSTETLAEAASRLFREFLESRSSRSVLREAGNRLELLPGANGAARVLGVCEPSDNKAEAALFLHNHQPDTLISIFNSPFGPDVLIVTDKLSEGIDLHRYCRHLIHYELDPSPIRTVQRNGRLRRVNSWAAITGQPILLAYPAFRGTRDYRLVQVMKKRIGAFSLLLGGIPDFDIEDITSSDEAWRNQVVFTAKVRLEQVGGQLCANHFGSNTE